MKQAEREALVLTWGSGVKPSLEEVFGTSAHVSQAIGEGNLIFSISVATPLDGRPHARGMLNIKVSREALDDYLLREDVGEVATRKFLAIVNERRKGYVPEPSESDWKDPKAEVWLVYAADVRVR